MIELELKAVVAESKALLEKLRTADAHEEFNGRTIDQRFDFPDGSLTARDEVIRVRTYHDSSGQTTATIDWKGPGAIVAGYKQREELNATTTEPDVLVTILRRLGLRMTRSIERDIQQFSLEGATVRLEHYQQMDDLVEVEGERPAIERAIARMGIPRAEFSADGLALFADRYTARTGRDAITGTVGDPGQAKP